MGGLVAELDAIRVYTRENDDRSLFDDGLDVVGLKRLFQVLEAFALGIGPQQVSSEVDYDVRPAPFAGVHAANDENGKVGPVMVLSDPQRTTSAPFAVFFRQLDELAQVRITGLKIEKCGIDFRRVHDDGHGSTLRSTTKIKSAFQLREGQGGHPRTDRPCRRASAAA